MTTHVMSSTMLTMDTHQSNIPLALVGSGRLVTIRAVRGGKSLRQRLTDLGLHQGATVRVLKNDISAPLILAVKNDSRLALGRGMAHHIIVDEQASF